MLIQFVFIFILAAAFVVTWRRALQGVISWREGLLWSVLWVAASVVILMPESATMAAHLFGVGRGVDMVIYGSVVLLFVLVFNIFLKLDKMEKNLTDIVRTEALHSLPADKHHE